MDAAPTVTLAPWTGPWAEDDPDANFKADVAAHGRLDPLTTIVALADNLGIPVGGLVRAILGRWAAEGSSALLELGEPMVRRMATIVDEATAAGTDDARLDAYRRLAGLVGWLVAGLDDPAAYPDPVER